MDVPLHFFGEPVTVEFDEPPPLIKSPHCPDRFTWREHTYAVVARIAEWQDYTRRGRMARNMQPAHAAVAGHRGSWGVGRFYFRVRTDTDQVFDLYYDRQPKDVDSREGAWFLYREMATDAQNPPADEP